MKKTLKELAERRAHLKKKIELLEDLITLGYDPKHQLKEQFGEAIHDEVLNELDEMWLGPIKEELERLDSMEIDDGAGAAGGGAKRKAKAKGKPEEA